MVHGISRIVLLSDTYSHTRVSQSVHAVLNAIFILCFVTFTGLMIEDYQMPEIRHKDYLLLFQKSYYDHTCQLSYTRGEFKMPSNAWFTPSHRDYTWLFW